MKELDENLLYKSIETVTGFLNISSIYLEINNETDTIYVGIDIKNIGVSSLFEFRQRLELELSFIIGECVHDLIDRYLTVNVDIGCC